MEAIPQRQRVAYPVTEPGVIRTGEDTVDRQSLGRQRRFFSDWHAAHLPCWEADSIKPRLTPGGGALATSAEVNSRPHGAASAVNDGSDSRVRKDADREFRPHTEKCHRFGALHPRIIRCGICATCVTGVDHPARFDKHDATFLRSHGAMFDALGHDIHLAGRELDSLVPELECHRAVEDNEDFVRVDMRMPDKFAPELDELELVVVHLRNHAGRPVLREPGELVSQIDRTVRHCSPDAGVSRARSVSARMRLQAALRPNNLTPVLVDGVWEVFGP